MTDAPTSTPLGWLATRPDGGTELFIGAKPYNASAYASVVELDTLADVQTAQAGLRSLTRPVDLTFYAQDRLAKTLWTGQTFNVAASGSPAVNVLCDGTNATRADLAMFALFGQQSPAGTKSWLDNIGMVTVLTGTQLVALATLVGTWIDDGYAALGQILAGIASSPAAITTTAQIDSALASF